MESNPYQAPQPEDHARTLNPSRRFKVSLWEFAVLSWIITIVIVLLFPNVDYPTQPVSQDRQAQIAKASLALTTAVVTSVLLTLVSIANTVRKQIRS